MSLVQCEKRAFEMERGSASACIPVQAMETFSPPPAWLDPAGINANPIMQDKRAQQNNGIMEAGLYI